MKDLSTVQDIGTNPDFLNGNLEQLITLASNIVHQDPIQFFQKLMDLASLSPNGNFDNEANGYQLIDALKSYIEIQEFILQSIRTEKGTKQSFLNTTPIALTVSKLVTFTKGVGDIIEITGSGAYHVIDQLSNSDGTAHGEHLYILIGGSQDITISHLAIASNLHIETITGKDMIVSPGTIIKFINDPDTANNFIWKMVSSSQQTSPIHTKIIDLEEWNMYVTGGGTGVSFKDITHGIADFKKIRSMTATIISDDETNISVIDKPDGLGTVAGGIAYATSTIVRIIIYASGAFDDPNFNDDSSFNRGWITIEYDN